MSSITNQNSSSSQLSGISSHQGTPTDNKIERKAHESLAPRPEESKSVYGKLRDHIKLGHGKFNVAVNPTLPIATEKDVNYDAKETRNQLLKLFSNSEQQLRAGSSLLKDLFFDYFFEGLNAFLLNQNHNSVFYANSKKMASFGLERLCKILGDLSIFGMQGNHIIYPIGFDSQINLKTVMPIILDEITLLELTINPDFFNSGQQASHSKNKNTAQNQKILHGIKLFKDIAKNEIHLLFSPLTSEIDFTDHFSRLHARSKAYSKQILQIEELAAFNHINKKDRKIYSRILSDGMESRMQNCESISEALLICKNNSNSIEDLRSLIQLLLQIFIDMGDIKNIIEKKTFSNSIDNLSLYISEEIEKDLPHGNTEDLSNKNDETNDKFALNCQLRQFDWLWMSILQESALTALHYFIKESRLTLKDLDTALKTVINTLQALQNTSLTQNMFIQFEKIEAEGLSPQDQKHYTACKEILDLIGCQAEDHLLFLLKGRLDNCHKNGATLFDRTLAFWDAYSTLVGFNVSLEVCLNVLHKNDQVFDSEEIKTLYFAIENYHLLRQQLISSGKIHIESLLGKCFEESEAAFVKNVEKMENDSKQAYEAIVQNEEAAVAKKKKKKNKTPSSAAPSEKVIITNINDNSNSSSSQVQVKPKQLNQMSVSLTSTVQPATDSVNESEQIILSIKKLVESSITGNESDFRQTWRDACLVNLEDVLMQLEEFNEDRELSRDVVFGSIDLARRLMEHALGAALTHFPVMDENGLPLFEQVDNRTHMLHEYVEYMIDSRQSKNTIPKNVRVVVHALRKNVNALSYANSCVNYPFSTALKKEQTDEAFKLVNFLREIDKQLDKTSKNISANKKLLVQKDLLVKGALLFVKELLLAISDSEYGLDKYSTAYQVNSQSLSFFKYVNTNDETQGSIAESVEKLFTDDSPTVAETEQNSLIKSREEALTAIEEALLWIRIRKMIPVIGRVERFDREERRNASLANVSLYLQRLKEKIQYPSVSRVFGHSLDPLDLLRKGYKELCLAYLYHGDYYQDSVHIVHGLQLTHLNNPLLVNQVLRKWSANVKALPIQDGILSWMRNIHQVISYPVSPEKITDERADVIELRSFVDTVKTLAKQKRELANGFSKVLSDGNLLTQEKHDKLIAEFHAEQAKLRSYKALEALLLLLRKGVSLSKTALGLHSGRSPDA